MKIPKSAKRVFKGVLFDVYHWKQKMFDGSFATFEIVKRLASVQIIAVVDNKLVVLEEEQPHYGKSLGMVGGQIERGQSPLSAAKRELLEETGLKAEKFILWKKKNIGLVDWDVYYYIAKNCKIVSKQELDCGEKVIPKYVSLKKYLELIESDSFKNKHFSNLMFRIKKDKQEFAEFKKLLFE